MTKHAILMSLALSLVTLAPALAQTNEPAEPAPLAVFEGPAIQPGQEFDVRNYYPVAIGNWWKYQDTADNNVQFKLEIKKTVPVNGTTAALFERSTKVETDAITTNADGMLLHAQQRTNRDGSILATNWTPPVKFTDLKTKFGNKYSTTPSYTNPGTGNKMTWASTVVGVGDVTAGTNKFTNCVRIKVLVTDSVLGVKLCDFEMWVAKGIGVVQRQGNFFGVFFAQKVLEWQVKP
ncbi:MAG: hypothetical protein HY816_06660 [Candidatus Wallbacteria bacterium]|nr:hypothetical protein [Candidatus Wallbacteria bacterium]